MNDILKNSDDYGCSITCGKCKKTSPFDQWCTTPVNGELPKNQEQCPFCKAGFAIERKGQAQVFDDGFIIPPDNQVVPQISIF